MAIKKNTNSEQEIEKEIEEDYTTDEQDVYNELQQRLEEAEQNEYLFVTSLANSLSIPITENDTTDIIKEKINNKTNNLVNQTKDVDTTSTKENLKKNALKLVRVLISNNDPSDSKKKGDFYSAGNDIIGQVSNFVPYGKHCGKDGYHIPQIIYDDLITREFTRIETQKLPNGSEKTIVTKSPKFNIVVLPQLTPEQLKELKDKQKITLSELDED